MYQTTDVGYTQAISAKQMFNVLTRCNSEAFTVTTFFFQRGIDNFTQVTLIMLYPTQYVVNMFRNAFIATLQIKHYTNKLQSL